MAAEPNPFDSLAVAARSKPAEPNPFDALAAGFVSVRPHLRATPFRAAEGRAAAFPKFGKEILEGLRRQVEELATVSASPFMLLPEPLREKLPPGVVPTGREAIAALPGAAGTAAGLAAGGLVSAPLRAAALSIVPRMALEGAAIGGASGLTSALAAGEPIPSVAQRAGEAGLAGAALGGGFGVAGRLAQRLPPEVPMPAAPRAARRGEFAPTTRAPQAAPEHVEFVERVEASPSYRKELRAAGGGRPITHAETLENLRRSPPMTVEELAARPAEQPVSTLDVARAAALRDRTYRGYGDAIARGDLEAASAMEPTLAGVEAGYNRLTATPGRALEFQKLAPRISEAVVRLRELRDRGVPFEVATREADRLTRAARRLKGSAKAIGEPVLDAVRALEDYSVTVKLTSPVTHAVNTISNAFSYLQRVGEQYLVSAQRLLAGDLPAAQAAARFAWGTSQGFADGARKFLDIAVRNLPEEAGKLERVVRFRAGPLSWPGRFLQGADAFWKAIFRDSVLKQRAFELARREGLAGEALARRVTELADRPTEAMVAEAEALGREFTFQSADDFFLRGIEELRDVAPGTRLFIPFIRTPYNIVRFQWQRSLLGLVSPRNIRGLWAGGPARDEAVARIAMGSALSLGAWSLVQRGEVTGAMPTDSQERALWQAEGRQPYSIRVGNYWFRYGRFSPIGLYLSQVADLESTLRSGEPVEQKALDVLTRTLRGLKDATFLQGMSAIFDAIGDPERYLARVAQLTVTGLIPNALRDVRLQSDRVLREARGIPQAIANIVPGLSPLVPPRVDELGQLALVPADRLARATKIVSEPAVGEPAEAARALREAGAEIGPPRTELRTREIVVKLEGFERSRFLQEMGLATLRAILTVSRQPSFRGADRDRQARALEKAVDRARDAVRTQWKSRIRQVPPAGERRSA